MNSNLVSGKKLHIYPLFFFIRVIFIVYLKITRVMVLGYKTVNIYLSHDK